MTHVIHHWHKVHLIAQDSGSPVYKSSRGIVWFTLMWMLVLLCLQHLAHSFAERRWSKYSGSKCDFNRRRRMKYYLFKMVLTHLNIECCLIMMSWYQQKFVFFLILWIKFYKYCVPHLKVKHTCNLYLWTASIKGTHVDFLFMQQWSSILPSSTLDPLLTYFPVHTDNYCVCSLIFSSCFY